MINNSDAKLFAALKKDLQTYKGDWSCQGFWVMIVYRFGRWRYTLKNPIIRKVFSLIYKILFKFIQIITLIEIPCEVDIGEGLRIDHFGPIVINGYAKLGKNCVIRHGVTIGIQNTDELLAVPVIGDNVDIGCGAAILGKITIGNNVKIGANSVVLKDVPDNATAVGVPAKIKI